MKKTWKCLAALLLVCMMVAVLPGLSGAARAALTGEPAPEATQAPEDGPVAAAEVPGGPSWEVDRESGTLSITPGAVADDLDELEDLAQSNVVVDIYQVATAVIDGGKIEFTLLPRYAELREHLDEVLANTPSEEDPRDSEGLRELSQEAAWLALPDKDDRDTWDTPFRENIPVPTREPIELPFGLYLVVTHGDRPEDYVDVIRDEDGDRQVVTHVETEEWIYTYSPQLVFVPGTEYDENNNPLGWKFDVEMFLKHTREQLGSLEIIKTVENFVADHPGLFVFQVDIYVDGQLYQSGIYELRFSEGGSQSLRIDGLPSGAEVVVTEVYDGANYQLVTDATVTGTITANEVLQVEFVNEGGTGEGGAITNHFSYDEENGWVWTPIPEVE